MIYWLARIYFPPWIYLLGKFLYFCPSFLPCMRQKAPTELGQKPIGRLLSSYALPAIIAMTASSLYNLVDRFFIGHGVGVLAIQGLTTTFPFMNLSVAIGAMVGVGASTLISVRLGQKDYATANRVLGNTITLNIILGIAFTLACWCIMDPMLFLFGASQEDISYARDYMEIILIGNVVSHSYFGLNAVLRAAGHPRMAMRCTLLTVVLNTILDPVFIWTFQLGIRGAAIATILSQAISLAVELRLFSRKNDVVHLQSGIYRPDAKIVRQTLTIGLSPFLMNVCACLVVGLINNQMARYGGGLAKGAYGIVNGIVFLFLMVVMGLNQGMQPIVGYNWGARQNDRVWRTLKYTICAATTITSVGFCIGVFCPEPIVGLFINKSEPEAMEFIDISSRGFRICVSVFPIVGCQMVISNFFQSIGHAGKSIFLSVSRQLLFLIPFLVIMPLFYGERGVWMSIPMADTVSFCFASGMLWWEIDHIKGTVNREVPRTNIKKFLNIQFRKSEQNAVSQSLTKDVH